MPQVETTINSLREGAVTRTKELQQEMSTMQVSTSSVRREWTNYMDKAEYHYLEDNAAVESGRREMEETLLNWFVLILFFFFPFLFHFSRYRTYVITYGTSVALSMLQVLSFYAILLFSVCKRQSWGHNNGVMHKNPYSIQRRVMLILLMNSLGQ